MSAICGIIDFEKNRTDFTSLRGMGRAAFMRGGGQSAAYINGGYGFLCNRDGIYDIFDNEDDDQPLTVSLGGKNYTVMLDGEISDGRGSGAQRALECYISFGKDCFSHFDGDFAIAICDEYRGEVLLARSQGSTRPLFCSFFDGKLCFCSEPKGLFRAMQGPVRVDERVLKEHILSPIGKYGASDIFLDIDEIGEGVCAVYSRYYSSAYSCASVRVRKSSEEEHIDVKAPDPSELRSVLGEALFAFDYPQFDAYMPSVISALRHAQGRMTENKKALCISEGGAKYPERYLKERADRLGTLCSVRFESVACEKDCMKKSELDRMDKALETLLFESDTAMICRVFGDGAHERVRRERDIEARIRMTGMLIQSQSLFKLYTVLLCSENGVRDAYASRLSTI